MLMPTKRAGCVKQPTIIDVARHAGVSKSLVSLVMRGSDRVSDERRAAVLAAAEELGYRPNAVARSLVERRSRVIGTVLSDIHNPYFADLADGIEEGAVMSGYRAVVAPAFLDARRESAALDTLLQMRVDGLIMAGATLKLADIEKAASRVPMVIVARATRSTAMDSIRNDDVQGASAVVDHLVGLGHERIVHIHAGTAPGARGRRRGYERAMRRHGLHDHIACVRGAFTHTGGLEAMRTILGWETPPTAVFVANDFAAIGALEALDDASIRVPEDMSIAGYDNVSVSGMQRIALTTVDQPATQMGRQAVELLIERIDGERARSDGRPRHIVVPPRLVVRETTGRPPGA